MMQGLQSEYPRHAKLRHTQAKTALFFGIADFLLPVHSASRALSAAVKRSGRKASTHFYPGPSLRMNGAVTPLLHIHSWRVQGQRSMVKSMSYLRLLPQSR